MSYKFRHFQISDHMLESLQYYVTQGRPVGDFLTAVLEHDLMKACGRADDENLANLPAFCAYLYNEMPGSCHGSREKVSAWLAKFVASRQAPA